jgi:hypothetical protein
MAIIRYLFMRVTTSFDYVINVLFIVLLQQVRHIACIYYLLTTKPTLKKGANLIDISHGVKAKTI